MTALDHLRKIVQIQREMAALAEEATAAKEAGNQAALIDISVLGMKKATELREAIVAARYRCGFAA